MSPEPTIRASAAKPAEMKVGQVWRDKLRGRQWTVTWVGTTKAHLYADETVFVAKASVWIDRLLASDDWKLVTDV